MVELKLKSWGTFDLQVLACRENVAVALVLKIWEYWNGNCHICCLSTDHAPLAEAILPQQDLHQGFLLGQLGGKCRVVLGTVHGLRLRQESDNCNVSPIIETFTFTVGLIKNGTLVFVNFSVQDASILKISVAIIKRRSWGFQNTPNLQSLDDFEPSYGTSKKALIWDN